MQCAVSFLLCIWCTGSSAYFKCFPLHQAIQIIPPQTFPPRHFPPGHFAPWHFLPIMHLFNVHLHYCTQLLHFKMPLSVLVYSIIDYIIIMHWFQPKLMLEYKDRQFLIIYFINKCLCYLCRPITPRGNIEGKNVQRGNIQQRNFQVGIIEAGQSLCLWHDLPLA